MVVFSETFCATHQYTDQQNTLIENCTEQKEEMLVGNTKPRKIQLVFLVDFAGFINILSHTPSKIPCF